MARKGFIVAALAALFALPTAAKAAVDNPFELTLGGGAAHGPDLNGFSGNVNASIGYYFTDTLEGSVRQTVQYTDIGSTGGGGAAWNGSTRLALDLHFPLGDRRRIVPFIGANIGYVYGESVNDTWEAAPEAGVKVYLDDRTFVFVQAEYQFFFDQNSDASSAFSDGSFVYSIGLGFRF
ncbi:MAG TPA: outer membrane beta-barrel protein [Humisphaera sp.]